MNPTNSLTKTLEKLNGTPSEEKKPVEPKESTPPTVQNVQEVNQEHEEQEPEPTRSPYIEMAKDENNEWSWCLWAANGRPMAVSATSFKKRHDCNKNVLTTIELFRLPALKIVAAL